MNLILDSEWMFGLTMMCSDFFNMYTISDQRHALDPQE